MGASSSSQPERSQLEHLLDDVKEPPENPGRKLAELMEKKRKDPIARDRSRSTARDNANISIAFIARLDEDAKEAISRYDEYVAFWNERSIFNMKEINAKMQKKQALEKRGKLLKYGKQSLETQTLLDASRLTEWERYKKFEAVSVISEKEALQLIAAGAECLPMQWIELDKMKPSAQLPTHYRQQCDHAWLPVEIWKAKRQEQTRQLYQTKQYL